MPRGRRQILGLGLPGGIWEYQILSTDWVEPYDDIIERIRKHGSLDLLAGSPDLGGDARMRDRIGPPYGFTLELQAKRARAEEEAQQRQRAEEHRKQGEEAWSKVRLDPVPSGDTFTCPKCGFAEAILLPPPGYGRRLSGRFLYTCGGGCSMTIGMISKRLAAETEAMRQLVAQYGWPANFRTGPMPPHTSMMAGC